MELCGIKISCRTLNQLLRMPTNNNAILVTVNAEAIVRAQNDKRLKSIINSNLASIDGQIPLWLFRRQYPHTEIEKISGSDLIYSIPEYAELNNLKVFLLGGKEDSNKDAIKNLRLKYPKLLIDGFSPKYHPYPFTVDINNQIKLELQNFKPDILFVGFGMGKQEYWEDDNKLQLSKLGIKLTIGCGGSFEFASGKIKRAPMLVQNIGLEGFWRLLNEFRWFRIKRLLISSKIFYYYVKYHII